MFTFTPLLGAQSASPASSSLLELDGGVKILIDVGWDSSFATSKLDQITQHVSTLSVILLTHPTLDHLGAYAHYCKHIPQFNRIPVYATIPVVNLGRALLEDLYTSSKVAASVVPASALGTGNIGEEGNNEGSNLLLQPPSVEEIAGYFNAINSLKYSQPHQPIPSPFSPPLGGLTVTAYSAGHTLGGTIWHIQHGLESIVYAADWNQTRENLSPGAAWLSSSTGGAEIIEPLRQPTALICSSRGIEKLNPLSRKKRDETLITLVRDTISQGGKVLIPADSSARVLEIAFLLNSVWRENIDGPHSATYKNAQIYMASKTSKATMRYLQSMLEWMDESVMRDAEAAMTGKGKDTNTHPLDWNHVKQIEKQSQLEKVLRRKSPAIILASDSSLEWGFSRLALQALAKDSRNLVIMTEQLTLEEQGHTGLGAQLFNQWQDGASQTSNHSVAKIVDCSGATIQIRQPDIKPLEGDEVLLYNQYLARQRQLHSTQQGDNTIVGDTAGADLIDDQASVSSDSSDEDEDAEHQGKALNLSNQITQSHKRKVGISNEDLGINVLIKGKGVYDYDVRGKRGREKVFPFIAPKHRGDDFGDLIKPEDYLRAEEKDDMEGADAKDDSAQDNALGQKRKWGDVAPAPKGRRDSKPTNKRAKDGKKHQPDDIDAAIARATGEAGGKDGAPAANDDDSDSNEESDYEPEDAGSEGPQKIVYKEVSLELHLKIAHVDYTGLFEKRDLQMLIPLIRPRKLILISGSQSETTSLARECRELLSGGTASEVFSPLVGEVVDASVDTNAWSLKLSSRLIKKLVWQNVKGLGVVALTGQLSAEPAPESSDQTEAEDDSARKKLKLIKPDPDSSASTSTETPLIPILDILPQPTLTSLSTTSSNNTTHHATTHPIHVGDLRIADLRALLRGLGHQAEFRGEGTLLVDGSVVVRKGASGRIEVEAGAGGLAVPQYRTQGREGTFWAVRRAVYQGLAVVAGSH
jgi:cleavage and polyadenylation specificity factor subunit 2